MNSSLSFQAYISQVSSVNYLVCYINIPIVSNEDVFNSVKILILDDFPKISTTFQSFSKIFLKVRRKFPNIFPNISEHFPEITEDC